MNTVVITGANRGIGLALARRYAARGDAVIAACRRSSEALDALEVEVLTGIDVTEARSLDALAARLHGHRVDVLVLNAGVLSSESLSRIDDDAVEAIRRQFEVNAIAPLRVTHALLPSLEKGSKVAILTSRMGSIEDNGSGGYYGYRMSKAAVNAAGKSLAIDLASRGVAVVLLHPGFVQTEMVGGHGDVTPDEAAESLVARIDELDLASSGSFRHANGESLPW
jgi:NAD(P)-dependent dehydrogenase (short-subunit alcohol dehydrogenase family)